MKKALFLINLFIYFVASFINLDFNFLNWTMQSRVVMIYFMIKFSIIIIAYFLTKRDFINDNE